MMNIALILYGQIRAIKGKYNQIRVKKAKCE